jgi:hypothetical protein
MAAPNLPKINEYLRTRPHGAYGWQIAEYTGSTNDSMGKTLAKLQARGKVIEQEVGETRGYSIWILPADIYANTPPTFRAKEILAAFQNAARAKQPATA